MERFENSAAVVLEIARRYGIPLHSVTVAKVVIVVLALALVRVVHAVVSWCFFGRRKQHSRRRRGNAVLILGQCGAGKTSLFFQLRNARLPETVSSLKPNQDSFPLAPAKLSRNIEAIDFPGHQRLQLSVFPLIPKARCIVYAIDSTNKPHIKMAAEHIFELLTSDTINECRPPIILACNKSDLPSARPVDQIRDDLQREIERLRMSRAATLEGQDEAGTYLGVEGEPFDFSMSPCSVTMCGCSVVSGDISGVLKFLELHMG